MLRIALRWLGHTVLFFVCVAIVLAFCGVAIKLGLVVTDHILEAIQNG